MEATNVRLRLLATKTLLGEYLPLAKGDDTVTRRVNLIQQLRNLRLISTQFHVNKYSDILEQQSVLLAITIIWIGITN